MREENEASRPEVGVQLFSQPHNAFLLGKALGKQRDGADTEGLCLRRC